MAASARRGVLFAAVLLLGSGCTGEPDSTDRPATPSNEASSTTTAAVARLSPECPAPPDEPLGIASAQAANALMAGRDLPAWDAADIGASVRLTDGRIVWAFGDTLRKGMSPGIVSNSMLVTSGECASQLLPAQDGPVIPDEASDVVHWPMSIASWPNGSLEHLVVICSRIHRGGSGDPFDFAFLGTSAAVFDVPDNGVPRLRTVHRITPDNPNPAQVNWGAASFTDARWLYVYGTRLTGEHFVFGRELFVSRVPLASPSDRSTWRFWDGSEWQPEVKRAAVVLQAEGGVSQTLSVDDLGDGRYLAVSKRDGDFAEFVYSWSAPSPTGPWTPHKGVSAPSDLDKGLLQYAPLAHPEVRLDTGQLLVAVSRNTTDLRRLVEDPDLGVPNFVEVALP